MAQLAGRSSTHPRAPWLVAAAALAALVAALAVIAARHQAGEAGEAAPPAIDYRLPAGPKGLVTLSFPGGRTLTTTADGTRELAARPLPGTGGPPANERYPSPDGRQVAWVERLESGAVNLLVPGGIQQQLSWQIAGPSDPTLVDDPKAAAAAVRGVPLRVAWSPDSKTLAFGSITGEPYTLNLYKPSYGTAANSFQVAGGYVGELGWSPDGRYLAISTYTIDRLHHTVLLWDSQAPSAAPRVLVDGCHITWSPDSQYLAVHRDPGAEPGTWVLSADGSYAHSLSDDPESFPEAWAAS